MEGHGVMPCAACKTPLDGLCDHQESGQSLYEERRKQDYLDIINGGGTDAQISTKLKKLSMYPEMSALFGIRHPNVYFLFGVDILHMLDVGLSKDLWTLVVRWLHGVPVKSKGKGVDVERNDDEIINYDGRTGNCT